MKYLFIFYFLVLVVSLIPTCFTDWFLTLAAAQSRAVAVLFPLLAWDGCTLEPITHPTILIADVQIHPLRRAAFRHQAPALLVVKNRLALLRVHSTNDPGVPVGTEYTLLAVTRLNCILPHITWTIVTTIPVQGNRVID